MAELRVGTSGWQYDHWRGRFYPKGLAKARWFEHYARHFDTVELNNPFYRLPSRDTFAKWRAQAPRGFVYSVKLNRFITHIQRLKTTAESVRRFYEALGGIGRRGEVVLVQLPPNLRYDPAVAEAFFAKIARRRRRHALEPRHETWLTDEAVAHLRRRKVALCIVDAPRWPTRDAVTAPFAYLRFHGRESLYASNYPDGALREYAERIREWRRTGIDVYAYFNNDANAYAVRNALRLRELVA